MDEYIVSARKYRPMSFDSVVGQSSLTTTLKNAVRSKKLAHAYLFCGPRGVGKTTCARIFAKAINCSTPTADGEACGQCESCKAFLENRSYNIFELDAASNNSVENIKALMEQTHIPPQVGRYKVFIIDEVHMLSTAAFNAFLKTLEEPPAHVIFILATTEKHKILPTILSRCQIYDFERMTVPNIIRHLKMVAEKEGIQYEEEALAVIAEKADGGMRDALSIFDQTASFAQGNVTYEKVIEDLNVLDSENYFNIVNLALENKVADIMVLLNSVIGKGFDGGNLVNGLAAHVRNVLMAKDASTLPLLEVSEAQRARYKEQAAKCPTPFLYKALQVMNRCDVQYRQSSNKRLLVELTLIEVAQITQKDDTSSAGRSPKRLKTLFKHLAASAQQPIAASQVVAAERTAARTPHTPTLPKESSPQSAAPATTTVSSATGTAGSSAGAATSRPRRVLKSSIGLSWSNLKKEQESKPAYVQQEEEVTNQDEQHEFTQADLELQWRAMCVRMQKGYPGLAARLKNLTPHITTWPNVELVVENQLLLNDIAPIRNRLRITMANTLHNGQLDFSLRLAKQEEIKPKLSRRELFDKMKSENAGVAKLVGLLSLDLV